MEEATSPLVPSLPESLLLLATDADTGRIDMEYGALDYGLAGATLLELLLRGKLESEAGELAVVDDAATGEAALDRALSRIEASKPRSASDWVERLAHDHLKDLLLDRLLEQGVLRREEHHVLRVLPHRRYPAVNAAGERPLVATIRAAVIEGATPEPRVAALIGLLQASNLTHHLFNRDERKRYEQRIKVIASGETMGAAVAKAIAEMQAAIVAATIAPS